MVNPFDNERWDANVRFNALVAGLATREQVIGHTADSTIVALVPTAVTR